MAKKVYNINAMRPVLVIAHNQGNKKAINKDLCDGAQIDHAYFVQWQVNCKKLQETVWDYVTKKHNQHVAGSDITEGDVYAARERIYPKWKKILESGEAEKIERELHVNESDVEDLIGFVWDFFATTRGTTIAQVRDDLFRRKVESLIGCAIAKNAVLTDHERDVLDTYYKASKAIQSAIDAQAELEVKRGNLNDIKDKATSDELKMFIDKELKVLEDEEKAIKERKTKAEATEKEYSTRAKQIEAKIALAV